MKINILLYSLLRTGAIRVLFEYANLLTAKGHDVTIYHTLIPYKEKKETRGKEFLVKLRDRYRDLIRGKKNISNFEKINFKIKLIPYVSNYFISDADAVIFTYWPIAYKAAKLNESKGKKIYLIQAYETWGADPDILHGSYDLGLINITVSKFLKDLIKSKSNADSTVLLNGIDYNKFYPEEKKLKELNIAFIHYPMEYKGVSEILKAIELVRKKYDNLSFTSFGMNKPDNLPGYIKFIYDPSDSQIREIYSDADIFICASREEGFYLTPAEAMACKCAVITSKVGAVEEFSVDKATAIHFEPLDYMKIYTSICFLIDNKPELERISTGGYNMVRETLNWDKTISGLEKLIKS